MKIAFTILLIIGILPGCTKSDFNQTEHSDLIIKAGFICGWGAGEDSIEISKTVIKYFYSIPIKSQQPLINKTRIISNSEWTEILNDVDMDEFLKLNYQSCNICVDGCDEWIYIQKDGVSHKITFGKGQKIDSINKLQTKLSQLRAEFNNL
jgi:hypothetical protein